MVKINTSGSIVLCSLLSIMMLGCGDNKKDEVASISDVKNQSVAGAGQLEKSIKIGLLSTMSEKKVSNERMGWLGKLNGKQLLNEDGTLSQALFELGDVSTANVSGWLVDPFEHDAGSDVYIVFDRAKIFKASYGLNSPDVALAEKNNKYSNVNFEFIFATKAEFGSGNHTVEFVLVNKNKTEFYVYPKKILISIK